MNPLVEKYDVFISYKNTNNGIQTEDSAMAKELYEFLTDAGIRTFFSGQTLAVLGADRYKEMIDDVLDDCSVLIVVGTSTENITSSWVRYEWDSFYNDILMGKKRGKMFSYVAHITPYDLPRTLRSLQCFEKRSSSLEGIRNYVRNALTSVTRAEKESLSVEKAEDALTQKGNSVNGTANGLLQFANLVACGDPSGKFVNPYISDEMADLIAKNTNSLKEYSAETCRNNGIDPVIYEVFLAQKIARINKPESCAKSYQLLHQVINCWRVFLNEDYQVVAYWIFIALEEDSYNRIKTGQVDEMDIGLEDVRFIDMPGRYKGYLLLSGTIEECRTPKVVRKLYSSWLNYIQTLAENEIFFDEIASMVGSAAGNSSLKNIGMKYYAEYVSGGKMYKYDMSKIDQIFYLKRNYPLMFSLYKEEYHEGD